MDPMITNSSPAPPHHVVRSSARSSVTRSMTRRRDSAADLSLFLANPNTTSLDFDLQDDDEDNHSLHSSRYSEAESLAQHRESNATKNEELDEIAKKETLWVRWSRSLFIAALLVCGSVLGGVAYYAGRQSEQAAFEDQFDNLAQEIVDMSQEKVMRVFDVLETLAVTLTSFSGRDTSGFWTLPHVEQHFGTARATSEAFVIAYLPLVTDYGRADWEAYSQEHQEWILDSHGVPQDSTPMDPIPSQIWRRPEDSRRRRDLEEETCAARRRRRRQLQDVTIQDNTTTTTEEREQVVEPPLSGPYAPVWLLSPPPPLEDTSILNYNMFDRPVFEKAVRFIHHTRKPTFLDVCTQTAWFGLPDPSEGDSLQTVVVQPVFEQFGHDVKPKIVGHLAAILPWDLFFKGILNTPDASLLVTMSNSCDEVFSYGVVGKQASFLEEAEVHDPKYNPLKVSSIFAEFSNPSVVSDDIPEGEHCVYTIDVYPTHDYEATFHTNQPMVYIGVVVSIFVFTALCFLIYDTMVTHRQSVVLKEANQTQALVSTLFPRAVQDRVKDLAVAGQEEDPETAKNNNEQAAKLPAHLTSEPIAELFPETTIMFGDLVGFTSWSSKREPAQVFSLLEHLYYEFDTVAKRRNVFKVETIGDCYVAVCGLPEAVPNHHIVMARFATDCLGKMDEVTDRLGSTLGEGTRDLGLRVGLHSGPCTAGVLRGDRARFQLFGDSMNTAARMESTGMKQKIHLSADTAQRLMDDGKTRWVQKREDLVQAKGKGTLQTWWLLPEKMGYVPRYSVNSDTEVPKTSEGSATTATDSE